LQVVECHLIAGDYDFLLKVVAKDLEAYRRAPDREAWQYQGRITHARDQALARDSGLRAIGDVADLTLKAGEGFKDFWQTFAWVWRSMDYRSQNFRFEFREANLRTDLYPALYRELADQKVSVLIATLDLSGLILSGSTSFFT
jgi:hypothetical protein